MFKVKAHEDEEQIKALITVFKVKAHEDEEQIKPQIKIS